MQNVTTLAQAELAIRRAGIVEKEMVEGKQLLRLCGLSAKDATDSIQKQISRHGFIAEKDFSESFRESTGGRPGKIYHFTVNAANHILLAAMTKEGKQARQEAIDLKTDHDRVANLINNGIAIVSQDMKDLAQIFGLSGNQALLSAARATETLTGHNPIKLLGVDLKADRKEKTFTVTEMGREFYDGMSPQKLNRRFAAAGLQNRVAGQWELTEAGKKHTEVLDNGKKRSNGTPVKQIKWFETVVEEVA